MFFVKEIETYAKVWEIKRSDKYTDLKISTSEKDKQTGNVKYSNWFARAVGHAHNALANAVVGNRILIKSLKLTNETKTAPSGEKKSYVSVVIFDAQVVPENGAAPSANTANAHVQAQPAAASVSDSEDDMPF